MTPLIDGLKKYIKEKNIRMHMPGHKAKDKLKSLTDLIPEIDMTEVPGVDNLHQAKDIIKKSQDNAAKVFKAKHTLYSVNGTTGGLYAAINSQTSPGDKVLIARDSHKAVYQALVLANLDCQYIYPRYDTENDILIGIDPIDVEEKLKNDSSIKVLIINYPSYYGVCSHIEAIAKIVDKHGVLLIVDEAHGSHLAFHKDLPKSALESGADLVVQSTHKTLPAFTQSSMVHVGTDKVDLEKLKLHMAIFQTTSPSYILMASIDYAVDYMDEFGYKELKRLVKKIEEITDYLKKLDRVIIYNGRDIRERPYNFDVTKFLFKIKGISGTRLEQILRDDYQIQVELSDHYYCLALLTALDEDQDLEVLKLAIEDIANNPAYIGKPCEDPIEDFKDIRTIRAKVSMSPYKAFYSDKISIQLRKSIGKIAGESIIPYPPGIPILTPGEEITREIVNYIGSLKSVNIEILGLGEDNNEIKIIKWKKVQDEWIIYNIRRTRWIRKKYNI